MTPLLLPYWRRTVIIIVTGREERRRWPQPDARLDDNITPVLPQPEQPQQYPHWPVACSPPIIVYPHLRPTFVDRVPTTTLPDDGQPHYIVVVMYYYPQDDIPLFTASRSPYCYFVTICIYPNSHCTIPSVLRIYWPVIYCVLLLLFLLFFIHYCCYLPFVAPTFPPPPRGPYYPYLDNCPIFIPFRTDIIYLLFIIVYYLLPDPYIYLLYDDDHLHFGWPPAPMPAPACPRLASSPPVPSMYPCPMLPPALLDSQTICNPCSLVEYLGQTLLHIVEADRYSLLLPWVANIFNIYIIYTIYRRNEKFWKGSSWWTIFHVYEVLILACPNIIYIIICHIVLYCGQCSQPRVYWDIIERRTLLPILYLLLYCVMCINNGEEEK